mgnify:CR=1 FL=1
MPQPARPHGVHLIADLATSIGLDDPEFIAAVLREAAQAAHAAHKLARPDEVLHFEYSTTSGVPSL